jgi:hypothetical protein
MTKTAEGRKKAEAAPDIPAPAAVAVGTSSYRQKYLFAFASQPEVAQYLRTQLATEHLADIPQLMADWQAAQPLVQQLLQTEQGSADNRPITALPEGVAEAAERLVDNDLLKRSFQLPMGIGIVDIDTLIAGQRTVNLEYVEEISNRCPRDLDIPALVEICLSPTRIMAPIQHLELGPNVHVFSSPSTDLRFLGAFMKKLTDDDLKYATMGGIPAIAIISFIGYGASPVNVLTDGSRIVLSNGFHRVYALRHRGVRQIPVLVQVARNVQLEFPPLVAGLPREYVLGHPRPVMMKDFFDEALVTEVRVKQRLRSIMFQAQAGQHDVPS